MAILGFLIMSIAIIGLCIYLFGDDLETKEQIKLYVVIVFFILAISIGAGILTGWK